MATRTQAKTESSTRIKAPRVQRDTFILTDNKMTVEEWAALPDLKPRYELIGGRLVQKMTTTSKHAWTVGELLFVLSTWGRGKGWIFLPEGVGIKLGENDGAVADISGFQPGTQLQPDATYFTQTPFLIVEVVSRSTAKRDRTDKKTGYARIGVQIYLIADPDKRTLEVYALKNEKYGSPQIMKDNDVWQPMQLPELQLEVARLWLNSTEN